MLYYNAITVKDKNLWYKYFEDKQECLNFIKEHPEYHMTPKAKSIDDFVHNIGDNE